MKPAARRPPPYSTDRAILEREVSFESFRASGAGGQHLHKTESAVRLVHHPSGVSVTVSDTRSQHQNREIAFERLAARLSKLNAVPKPRKKTRPTLGARKRRLEGKRQTGATKRLRSRVRDEG